MVLNTVQNFQKGPVDQLDASVADLETRVKQLTDEIANNSNKINHLMDKITTD